MREVKQYRYLHNIQLIFDTPTYTHNPFLIQCQLIILMAPLWMLILVSRHPMIDSENKKIKYTNHNHCEILICCKEITNTHKLCYQPLFSLLSYLGSFCFIFYNKTIEN